MINTMHDVIRYMKRFPDKIFNAGESTRMTAKTWKCSGCGVKYHSSLGRPIPSPCKFCHGICFEKEK